MNRTFSLIGLAVISASIGTMAACSSSSSSDDSASGTDSGTTDSSTTHDSGVTDAGVFESGPDDPDLTCTSMSTAAACQQCCGMNHTAGGTVAENAAIACACHGTGVVDGGASGDAGAGPCASACSATLCAATPASPDTACQTCLNTQISTAGGECADYFATTCMASTDCTAEQTCFSNCPKN